MKASRPKIRRKTYVCRKCNESDFRNLMEFTKHLRKCRGPVAPVEPPKLHPRNGVRDELFRLRKLGEEVRDLADKLLMRIE